MEQSKMEISAIYRTLILISVHPIVACYAIIVINHQKTCPKRLNTLTLLHIAQMIDERIL